MIIIFIGNNYIKSIFFTLQWMTEAKIYYAFEKSKYYNNYYYAVHIKIDLLVDHGNENLIRQNYFPNIKCPGLYEERILCF